MAKKIKIGITGGIGSGKSFVSDFIEEKGFIVLRSDLIAKELMQSDENIIKKIKKSFGEQTFNDGKLNTKYLAGNIFNDETNLEKINSIVHPPVIKHLEKSANYILLKDDFVFIESALIYEAKIQKMFDYVILICSDEKNRIDRIVKRDKFDLSEIKRRIGKQLPDEIKKEKASFIIDNNSTIENLKQKTEFILKLLVTLSH